MDKMFGNLFPLMIQCASRIFLALDRGWNKKQQASGQIKQWNGIKINNALKKCFGFEEGNYEFI